MSLSRNMTAIGLWQQAKRDIIDTSGLLHNERFDLVNRAVQTVAGQFYDLMSNFYMTEVVVTGSGGAYETGSTGTYTVATQTLALQTPSRNIVTTDIGKIVAFRIGTSTYLAFIQSIVSTSSFTVIGVGLPAANGTLASVTIVGNTFTSNTISLSGLKIMMTGQQIKLELYSTTSGVTIKTGTTRAIDTFITSGANKNTIVWGISGDSVRFAYGDSVTVGSLLLRYPRVPNTVSADGDYIDLPDGVATELAIIYLRGLMQQRLGGQKENNEQEIQLLEKKMKDTFGDEAVAEVVKDKILALK